MAFEDILEDVGGFGLYQKLLVLYLFPSFIIIPWLYVNTVFMTSTPEHWCYVPEVAQSNLPLDIQKQLIRPPNDLSCSMYDVNYSQILQSGNWNVSSEWATKDCDNGWQFDKSNYEATASTRWNMVCKDAHYSSLVISLVFIGNIFGTTIFGFMSDRMGRKPTFLTLAILVALSEVGSAFSPHFGLYLVLRTIIGSTTSTMYGVPYVILLELVSPRIRSRVNGITTTLWTTGLCVLPLVAWLTRNWFYLSIATSSAAACHLVYWLILPESPIWLISQKRYAEAAQIMEKISKVNGKKVHKGRQLLLRIQELGDKIACQREEKTKNSPMDFFKYPKLRKRFFLVTTCWIGNSIPYFGLQMNVKNLFGNEFLNFFLMSVVEVPAHLATWYFMERIGRRCCSISAFSLTAVACFMPIAFPLEWTLVPVISTLLAKIGASAGFMSLYQQGPELYPTVLRSMGMGMGCTIAAGSTFLVPYIVYLAEYGTYIPFIIFSFVTAVCGMCSLFLPETLNTKLPQTIADVENSEEPTFLCCRKRSNADTDPNTRSWTPAPMSPPDLERAIRDITNAATFHNLPSYQKRNSVTSIFVISTIGIPAKEMDNEVDSMQKPLH